MDFNLNFHPLDNLIKDKTTFWLEALVPFIDYKYKKYLILYIKYKEITAILNALEDISFVESCGFNCKAHSIDEVINGLAGFMPKDFSDNIKQMKSMIDMMSIMNTMDTGGIGSMLSGDSSPSHTTDNFSSGNTYNKNENFHNSHTNDTELIDSILNILDQEQ